MMSSCSASLEAPYLGWAPFEEKRAAKCEQALESELHLSKESCAKASVRIQFINHCNYLILHTQPGAKLQMWQNLQLHPTPTYNT